MRLASLLCVLATLAVTAEEVRPLPIELPKPAVTGTPRPIKVGNLEPTPTGPRVLPSVPVSARNLAFGKSVTTSARDAASGDISVLLSRSNGAASIQVRDEVTLAVTATINLR